MKCKRLKYLKRDAYNSVNDHWSGMTLNISLMPVSSLHAVSIWLVTSKALICLYAVAHAVRRRSNRDFYVPPFIGAVRRGRQECGGVSELNRRAARAWTPSAPRTISWDVLGSSDSKLLEAARSCGVRRHSSLCRWLSSSTVASRRVTQTAAAANTRQRPPTDRSILTLRTRVHAPF